MKMLVDPSEKIVFVEILNDRYSEDIEYEMTFEYQAWNLDGF